MKAPLERALKAAGLETLPTGIEAAKSLNSRHAGMRDAKKGTPAAEEKAAVQVLARMAAPEIFSGAENARQQLEIWAKFARNY